MSTPFINPYQTKDVVSTSLNNLDKQSQDIISYLDGLFSSETTKDKQLILDDGTVETLKPFQVANSQGAFWDKGTTYYFQPVADRLREISSEIQGKLNPTDVSATLKAGITSLFSKTLNDSRSQVSDNSTDDYASDWTYEQWYTNTSDPDNPINKALTLDDFLHAVGTAAFKMADAVDGDLGTQLITNTSGLQININFEDVAKLLDDGDNYYNDNNTINDPNKQPEFYLIGNRKLPVFGAFENTPIVGSPTYQQDLYNYQNKRIDPNSVYWNNPLVPKEPEEVFFDMVAIAITQQKSLGSLTSADAAQVRSANELTAQTARNNLKNIAGTYFTDSQAWYNSPAPRNSSTPPAFLLSKIQPDPISGDRIINYSNYDGSYGVFKPSDTGTLTSLIVAATGISTADVNATLSNWTWDGLSLPKPPSSLDGATHSINVDKIIKYYTQSYISASMTSTFGKKDSAISTKNFLIHEALNNLDPLQNPYLEEAGDKDVVKFDKLLNEVPPRYLRSPGDTANTHVSNQMMQLMDLFLENFDITTNRYIEDKRTLIDLFSGKLLKTAGENAEVQKSLFQNISSATKDISSQIKNTLTRGIPESAESQFTLDLFNQTAVRKEDYGLSPNPADPTKNFLPSSWANMKDKFLPAMYYYNPANPTPVSGSDEANNTLNDTTIAKNGLPAGFPIMDVRDFDQFFKATKLALTNHIMNYLNTGGASFITTNNVAGLYNEMRAFLADATTTTYPSWGDAGFAAGSQAAIFGDLSDKTNFSRAIQLYKSLDKIIDNMEDRVSSVGQSVPKIPRPATSPLLPLGTLQSSVAGSDYGDKPSPALVKSFLEMHEDTKGPAVSVDANAESLQRISYLINTFDSYSKFSQNSAFEAIYASEVFEADKENYASLSQKRPEPGPDGSMPEDKSIPKPDMAALSSSVLITKLGQMLTNKVNNLVQENNVIAIDAIDRGGPGVNIGDINTDPLKTKLSGSKESQTYLNNILKQISALSGGNVSVDVSAVGALISGAMETAMQTLITNTDDPFFAPNPNPQRMVFIDDETIDELNNLLTTLSRVSTTPGTPMHDLKQLLTNADLDGLKALAYPGVDPTHNAPGYYKFNSLTPDQQKLINDIRDKKFEISGSTYIINGLSNALPSTDLPDDILDTLGTLTTNISAMLYSSQHETPPRIFTQATNPQLFVINDAINKAKLDFTDLTSTIAGATVSYNAILNADVYEVGPGPTFTVTRRSLATAADKNDIIQARKDLLEELLYENKIGGVAINNLDKADSSNPYKDLLNPPTYSALDPDNLLPKLPDDLDEITNKDDFQAQIININTFITGFGASLTDASLEEPPRDIIPANDPILALKEKAKFNFTTGLKPITSNAFWDDIIVSDPLDLDVDLDSIKDKLINSKVGSQDLADYTGTDKEDIIDARTKLLEFFLEGKRLDPSTPAGTNNYTLTGMKSHDRYKDLITPVIYDYPDDPDITGLVNAQRSTPLALNSTVDNSKADSFTLKEIMTGNATYTNSLNDLENQMKTMTATDFSGALGKTAKQLYIRKMQHFNILFNTLSGGTTKNPPLAAFTPPELSFNGNPTTKTLNEYIESLASDPTIIGSTEFDKILARLEILTPITENINALEVSLAGEIKKPKSGPESEIYSTIHLLTQIENQTDSTPANYEAGILQLLNQRKIKDDTKTPPIDYLEHRNVADIKPQDGLYQYSGYAANLQYLDPANPLTISGNNMAPATTGNKGWDIELLLATKTSVLPPFGTLADAREFLVGLNEVYKDMQASKSPVIKEQLKVFDLWLRNNSFSPISDAALRGKDSLEADINILDHIQEGGGTNPTTINTFLSDSKIAAAANKKSLDDLDDIRTAGKGFAQRIDDGLSATELRNYFQENIFYPSATPFPKALPGDTRANDTKDYFGRTLDNSNLPVFGVNIFGLDPDTQTTYTVPPDIQTHYANANSTNPYTAPTVPPFPAIPDTISSNSYKNFGLAGVPTLNNPYQKIMENTNTLLTALTAAETAGHDNKVNLYKTMIKNLLGESGEAPEPALITLASAENTPPTILILPGDPILVDTTIGLTYGTNNYPSTNLKTKIIDERQTINEAINPAKYKGTINSAALANFALSSKADQATTVRTVGVEGKSIQELAILLYIMQMFESSNWDFEKYINDTSRYEMVAAVE
jgi:hypothetical protein